MISRRRFIKTLLVGAAVGPRLLHGQSSSDAARLPMTIDRRALVTRHNPHVSKLDPLSPLSVGNGEFAFTADVTGLQTLSDAYNDAMPLCTMSQWGWHTIPAPAELKEKKLRLVEYDTYGRKVGYQTSSEGQQQLFNWLRENPHRLHLGEIGLCLGNTGAKNIDASDIARINQELDLWRGVLTSRFELRGKPVE